MTLSTRTTRLGATAIPLLAACSNITPPNQTLTMGTTTISTSTSTSTSTDEYEWDEDSGDGVDTDTNDSSAEETAGPEPDLPPDGCPPDCGPDPLANIVPAHVLADRERELLYVTVRGDAPEHPNELVVIDPQLLEVVDTMFVGSNPGTLALSDDGTTLWVGLDGSHEIARVNLETTPPTVEDSFVLPPGDWGDLAQAGPMVVLPGTSDSVAVSLHRPDVSPSFAGVAILDDGIPRPDQTPGHTGASRLTGGPPGWLFGYNNLHTGYGFYAIEVLANGPTQTEHSDLIAGFGTDIVYADGRVYATSGEIVDVSNPGQPIPAGEFPFAGLVIPQLEQQRILMLSPPNFNESLAVLRSLDPMTFTQIDSVSLDFGDLETFFDFVTTDGETFAVIGRGWDWEDPNQLVVFEAAI